jgi:hypothetical protein
MNLFYLTHLPGGRVRPRPSKGGRTSHPPSVNHSNLDAQLVLKDGAGREDYDLRFTVTGALRVTLRSLARHSPIGSPEWQLREWNSLKWP